MDFIITILAFVGIMAGLLLGGNAWDKNLTKASCASFQRESGRQTKFVEYTYWTYDCLTPDKDGKWLSTDNIVEVTK